MIKPINTQGVKMWGDYQISKRDPLLLEIEKARAMANERTYNPASQVADDISTDLWRMRALAMRLRISEGHQLPFQHLSTAWTGEKVFVFVVEHDQAVTLEDDANLFPSDVLITQLRLIAK